MVRLKEGWTPQSPLCLNYVNSLKNSLQKVCLTESLISFWTFLTGKVSRKKWFYNISEAATVTVLPKFLNPSFITWSLQILPSRRLFPWRFIPMINQVRMHGCTNYRRYNCPEDFLMNRKILFLTSRMSFYEPLEFANSREKGWGLN